jgi:8-oxo-dGTP pyrophosphatase MutT (NUDIX family)
MGGILFNIVGYNKSMSTQNTQGVLEYGDLSRKTDYLFRVSLKGFIQNEKGHVLLVKETGRTWWDFPGGGMDHGEDIKAALARELKEEVNMDGDFSYRVIEVEPPHYLDDIATWQIRIIFFVDPLEMTFTPGVDGDEVSFIDPESLKDSTTVFERKVFEYTQLVRH